MCRLFVVLSFPRSWLCPHIHDFNCFFVSRKVSLLRCLVLFVCAQKQSSSVQPLALLSFVSQRYAIRVVCDFVVFFCSVIRRASQCFVLVFGISLFVAYTPHFRFAIICCACCSSFVRIRGCFHVVQILVIAQCLHNYCVVCPVLPLSVLLVSRTSEEPTFLP